MKKQYKHKQSNDVVSLITKGYYKGWYINNNTNSTIPGKYIENTNDWEEIVSKSEYTILSFMAKHNISPHTLRKDGNYRFLHANQKDFHSRSLEYCLEPKNEFKIVSVRRESDNEILTVGDTTNRGVIKQFEISDIADSRMLVHLDESTCGIYSQYCISSLIKIEPKQYLITSFRNKTSTDIIFYYRPDRNKYSSVEHAPGSSLETIINLKIYEIASIKRLSDDVEFKIGDKVKSHFGIGTIKSFTPIKDNTDFVINCAEDFNCEDSVQKVEKLFTTEDNVEIFDVKEYKNLYGVALQASGINVLLHGYNIGIGEYAKPASNRKWFYNKEKAEDFILLNKPVLSLQDVYNTTSAYLYSKSSCLTDLKKLVESKL